MASNIRYTAAEDSHPGFDLGLMEGVAILAMVLNVFFVLLFVFLLQCFIKRYLRIKKQRLAANPPSCARSDEIPLNPHGEYTDFSSRHGRPEPIYEEPSPSEHSTPYAPSAPGHQFPSIPTLTSTPCPTPAPVPTTTL